MSRVITLADGRRVKEVPEVKECQGCMFSDLSVGCDRPEDDALGECSLRGTIYQPADPEPVAVAEPVKREPLTDEQIAELMMKVWGCASIAPRHAPAFARAIERAHGIGGREGGAA